MDKKDTPVLINDVQLLISEHKKEIEKRQGEVAKLTEVLRILHSNGTPTINWRNASNDPMPHYIRKKEVLDYMRNNPRPVQNAEIVSYYHPTIDGVERESMIRRVGVIFFNLERDGLVEKEKRDGERGNYYTLIKK